MTPSFDLRRYQDPSTIQRVIYSAKTIAVVGLSNNHLRASYFVGFYLQRHGYRVIPVNPRESQILGEKSFKSLTEIGSPVDVVNVFRAPDALPAIAEEAVAIGAKTLWCQFTVINQEGGRIAEAGGLSVVASGRGVAFGRGVACGRACRGSLIVTVVPRFSPALSIRTAPPWSSTSSRTMASPSPSPP